MTSARTAAKPLLAASLHLKDLKTFDRFKGFSWGLVLVVDPSEVARIVEGYLLKSFLF